MGWTIIGWRWAATDDGRITNAAPQTNSLAKMFIGYPLANTCHPDEPVMFR